MLAIDEVSPELDRKFIDEARRAARPLTPEELSEYRKLYDDFEPPHVLDYSEYVTLVRNQGKRGGCGGYTALAILDILKSRERPYSPTFSYRYDEYYYNHKFGNQLDILQQKGCCTEASLPSDYDKDPLQVPTPSNDEEAALYKILKYSDVIAVQSLTVDIMKYWLWAFGPLFVFGNVNHTPSGHVFPIVGYSDPLKAFKLLNSWGSEWGDHGFLWFPYTAVTDPDPNAYVVVDSVRTVQNLPTKAGTHTWTGTATIWHRYERGHLTIRVGVEGKDPITVWDRPNHSFDASRLLRLTFPLPSYAVSTWPPNEEHKWFVEIDQDLAPSFVQELRLVKRELTPEGACQVRSFEPWIVGLPLSQASERIYIPTKKAYVLELSSPQQEVPPNGYARFDLSVSSRLLISDKTAHDYAAANCPYEVHRAEWDPEGESWIGEKVLTTSFTDESGKATFYDNPTTLSEYEARVVGHLGNILGKSGSVQMAVKRI